jgi:hypothetical protein
MVTISPRREVETAEESSDLHWFLLKISEGWGRRVPPLSNAKRWEIAKSSLLVYTEEIQTKSLGEESTSLAERLQRAGQSLTGYLRGCWNTRASELAEGRPDPCYWITAQQEMADEIVNTIYGAARYGL